MQLKHGRYNGLDMDALVNGMPLERMRYHVFGMHAW